MADRNMAIPEADELQVRLDSLPQELYDQIFDAVFTAAPGERILSKRNKCSIIAEGLKLLRISRATREKYATTYFGHGAEFVLERCAVQQWVHENWYKSLAPAHMSLLQKVTVVCGCPTNMTSDQFVAFVRMMVASWFEFKAEGIAVAETVFVRIDGSLGCPL